MKVAEIGKNGFNNTSFTLTNKASNMAMSVSRFINIHKRRCPMIHNYHLYYFGVYKGVKSLGKQYKNYAVYSKNSGKIKSCR